MDPRPISTAAATRSRPGPVRWRTAVAPLALTYLSLTSCSGDSPFEPVDTSTTAAAAVSRGNPPVDDLAVVAAGNTTLTVSWTQVPDGLGEPASYRLKFAPPELDWSSATIGCDRTLVGDMVGTPMSCTIEGLTEGTDYQVQLVSYRMVEGAWQNAQYSNVANGRTGATTGTSVEDLAVSGAAATSLTVRWTQIDDGTGQPARYRVKLAPSPLQSWREATTACDVAGDQVGAEASCTVGGLSPSTRYDVQLMSYRLVDGAWQDAQYSNVATGETITSATGSGGRGIWADPEELALRPTSGAEWERLLADAGRDWGVADIEDQDSHHDVYTLAGALVCVRTGEFCAKARRGVVDAIGTEEGARWLAVGRNLGSYVIAADLLDLSAEGAGGSDGARVQRWIEGWLTKELRDNNTTGMRPFGPFHAGANAAAQEGFVYAAVAAYLRDDRALERAWDAFRTFACDASAPDNEGIFLDKIVNDGWAADDARPCAVNPAGTSKRVPVGQPGAGSIRRLDGSLGADMRRGGVYQWEPGYTSYPWVGLEGFVPAAVILHRAGYPAFEVADRAVLRTHEYLRYLAEETGETRWFDGVRAREIVHLVNVVYAASFPVNRVVGRGRTVGYTSWTHPTW